MKKNLVGKNEALKYTNQSKSAFSQSVRTGMITPFFEADSEYTSGKIRLYYVPDLIEYGKNKRVFTPKNKESDK